MYIFSASPHLRSESRIGGKFIAVPSMLSMVPGSDRRLISVCWKDASMRVITEDSGLNGTCRVPPGGKACLAGAGAQARAETTRLLGRIVARWSTPALGSKGHSSAEPEAHVGSPSLGWGIMSSLYPVSDQLPKEPVPDQLRIKSRGPHSQRGCSLWTVGDITSVPALTLTPSTSPCHDSVTPFSLLQFGSGLYSSPLSASVPETHRGLSKSWKAVRRQRDRREWQWHVSRRPQATKANDGQ